MNRNEQNYILDFTIPKGEIGPTGPKGSTGIEGPTGKIGPLNSQETIGFVEYQASNTNGILQIVNITLTPKNTDTFQQKENFISFSKKGYYEFNISGILKEQKKANRATIILRTQHNTNYNNYITIRPNEQSESFYFTCKRIKRFSYPQDVSILLNKTNDSDAIAENIVLIIKKLPF